MARERKPAPERLEAIVEPARRCAIFAIVGERSVIIGNVYRTADDPPERCVTRGVVLNILPGIPPRERLGEVEELRRLAGVDRFVIGVKVRRSCTLADVFLRATAGRGRCAVA